MRDVGDPDAGDGDGFRFEAVVEVVPEGFVEFLYWLLVRFGLWRFEAG